MPNDRRQVTLIQGPRSPRLHIKASPIQNHDWYWDLYAATLCGTWLQVAWTTTPTALTDLDTNQPHLCPDCTTRIQRFT